MPTFIYSGITDKNLREEYDKLGRKDRTVEYLVGLTVSRESSTKILCNM